MNVIQMLSLQPWVERLGWTLIHFLWQGFAIAVLYAGVRRLMPRSASSSARYLIACAALAAMCAAPVVTWIVLRPAIAAPPVAHSAPGQMAAGATVAISTLPESIRATVAASQPVRFLPWVVMGWLLGAIVFWVRLAGGWVVAVRARSMLVRRAPPDWQDTLRKLAASIGLTRPVGLLVSALVQVPTVVGWIRPVVLVPVGALSGLPAEHVEALLLHELAHVRRHDYLVNILQSIVEALLFYHPAVWWVSGHIRTEREVCCDDVAVSITGDVLTYARALAQLESYRPQQSELLLAANSGVLTDRIARLLGFPRQSTRSGLGPCVITVAILLVAAAYGLFAQSSEHPSFAVASIKRNTANWSDPTAHAMGAGYRPGLFTAASLSLRQLIQFSYAPEHGPHYLPLGASRIVAGPAWIDTERYDIEAKPEGKADTARAWLMVQTLLADRFKLELHRETRELPIWELTAAASGLRLPPAKPATCVTRQLDGTFPRGPNMVDCGYVSGPGGTSPSRLDIAGRKVHVADLARELSLILDRPVVDTTGFTGDFDVRLTFTPDETLLGMPGFGGPGDPGGSRPTSDPNLPTLFGALQEQLGLKLVAAKGPVEVLVIDHVEKPKPN